MDKTQITEAVKEANAPALARLDEFDKRMKAMEKQPVTDNARGMLTLGGLELPEKPSADESRAFRRRARSVAHDRIARERGVEAQMGNRIGRYMRAGMLAHEEAMGIGSSQRRTIAQILEAEFKDADLAHIAETHQRSMNASEMTAGGSLLPSPLAAEFIEFLRPNNPILQAGARIVPMPSGSLRIARLDDGAVATYEGETDAVNANQGDTGAINLAARKLVAIVPVSNTLLKFGGAMVESLIAEDAKAAVMGKMNSTALRGAGSSNEPRGLFGLIDAAAILPATDDVAPTGAQAEGDLDDLVGIVQDADVPLDKGAYMLSPRVARYLGRLRTTNGSRWFEEFLNGRLGKFPYFETNHIPNDLGAGTESEIYFAAWDQFLIGMSEDIAIEFMPNATYNNAAGTIVSGVSRDESVFRIVSMHDFALRHSQAGSQLDAVKWGA